MNRILAVQSSLLALSQGEEVVDFLNSYPVSASEDEEDSDGERKHLQLLEAISGLDGKSRQRWAERSEASLQVSEFSVSTEGMEEKLALSELLKHTKPSSSLAKVKRQLKKVKSKKPVELPLSKEDTEQICREAACSKTSQALAKWDAVVLKNRRAEQLVFPLEEKQIQVACIEEVLLGDWKARTPLEQEIFNLLHKNQQPLSDPLLTPVEKASLKAMSLEVAKQRRAELQKARALQSYFEAKARRQKKIKSKKFHQVIRKKKAKEALRQFKGTVSPPALLEELEKREMARMVERMSLRHQSKGKWARARADMAKHDQKTHKEIQEQLARNTELTQKPHMPSDSEQEEYDAQEECELIPHVVNEVKRGPDSLSPWMQRNQGPHEEVSKTLKGPQKPSKAVAGEEPESEKEEKVIAEEESLLQELEKMRFLRRKGGVQLESQTQRTKKPRRQDDEGILAELRVLSAKIKKKARQDRKQSERSATTAPKEPVQGVSLAQDEEEPLTRKKPERVQTLEEVETLGMGEGAQEQELLKSLAGGRPQQSLGSPAEQRRSPKIEKEVVTDLQANLTVKSHKASALSLPTVVEEEDFGEEVAAQKQIIKEAFAGDDVVADFLKERQEAEEVSKSKAVALSLPGWGQWGVPGLDVRIRKRRRYLTGAPDGPPRKGKSLPNVIISEKRNIQAAAHKVNGLPFPFSHHYQFERTLQTPVGSTWNTPRAFQEMTAPRVVVKQGHIIEPIKVVDVSF
ncbi:U3 small nucleolar RNA-associated protein 14 homolog A-like [Vombatus ursinus]|uniref:UTP14A small subunit processome component n=1 Tax=Vombatus ursinus TaxID=29139 RepID=A0A4X2KRG4_VOMUR|nr:U3 small nucleolar RNA-associated protein 14 homolog A-like [Vombatus ursinus]XP_027696801.1 U3 small nucleolar RNA-associated protein 14 homolog A-like [Vombatus ursinus]XP_027696803.1 U3 small nucleolar RNA-associated protein 14 homolog A-like [Vombatus ursinus]XP_027696804.1 U3 small nucleolar RNA-associated protein 14 homolog A-like [Vombatus ursinus]XP_027696805.1 U3 small nucleolar RNA-associated protein 14 homolog A-like [Vombatus ursinus]XP_027696806.1 U3 small nucleolar RNA-associa